MKNSLMSTAVLIFVVLASILIIADSAIHTKDDINDEIKKFQERLEKFEKPNPELIKSLIQQAQSECKTNRTFDEEAATNMTNCIDGLFNQTELQMEFQNAIPRGELDDAFRKVCLKWPAVQNCMTDLFDVIEECFEKGKLVNRGVNEMVKFFCGANNDGALIALFLAEGGLNCLEKQGDNVRDCINENISDEFEHQENLCNATDSIAKCTVHFKKCSDPTPENLISSMVRQVQKVMKCPVTPERLTQSQSATGTASFTTIYSSVLLLVPAIVIFS